MMTYLNTYHMIYGLLGSFLPFGVLGFCFRTNHTRTSSVLQAAHHAFSEDEAHLSEEHSHVLRYSII